MPSQMGFRAPTSLLKKKTPAFTETSTAPPPSSDPTQYAWGTPPGEFAKPRAGYDLWGYAAGVDPMDNPDAHQRMVAAQQALGYGLSGQAYDVASAPITAQSIYEGTKGTMMDDWGRAQEQNVANLQRAGLRTSGAGYTQGSPYDLTNQNLAEAMSRVAANANMMAPGLNLQNMTAANALIFQNLHGGEQQYNQGLALLEGIRANKAAEDEAKKARKQGKWESIGQAVGGIAGAVAPFALAPFTGGASMALAPLTSSFGSMSGGLYGL